MNKLGVISFVISGYTLFYTSTVSEVNVDNSGICLQVNLESVYNEFTTVFTMKIQRIWQYLKQ